MPEPFSLIGLSVLGSYAGEFACGVVESLCKKSSEETLKSFGEKLGERLRRGTIARNHDLEGALVTSLRQTFHAFGHSCLKEDCPYDATGREQWLRPVLARLTEPVELKRALEVALPVKQGRDPAPREAARLAAPSLSPAFLQPHLVEAVRGTIVAVHGDVPSTHREWLLAKAGGTWTVWREGGSTVTKVTLAEVFAFSFRERVKHRAEVARLLMIDRLAAVGDDLAALRAAVERARPTLTAEAERELAQAVAAAIGPDLGARLDALRGDLGRAIELSEMNLGETQALRVEVASGRVADAASHAETHRLLAALPHRTRLGPVEPADYPERLVGRERELLEVVRVVTAKEPGTVVLLGEPGAGKSAIAQEAWRQGDAERRFGPRRWFVRCDEVRDRSAFVVNLVGQLHLEVNASDPWQSVLRALNEAPGLLVLDNLEDLFGTDQSRGEARQLLDDLRGLGHLGLAITVRAGRWGEALGAATVVSVPPLGEEALRTILLNKRAVRRAGTGADIDPWAADTGLTSLLREADGSPDVATHWARLSMQARRNLRRPSESLVLFTTPADLLVAWRQEAATIEAHDPAFRAGGALARQRGLEASYGLSLQSSRMTESGRALLALLGVLPSGVAEEDIGFFLEKVGEACDAVEDLGLAFFERGRLRTRAPLRQFFRRKLPLADRLWQSVERHWLGSIAILGKKLGAAGGRDAAARIGAEWSNLEVVQERAEPGASLAIQAGCELARYSCFTGLGDGRWLERHAAVAKDREKANCIERLGDIVLARSDHAEARARFQEALQVYREVEDKRGEADCIVSLGDIALARSENAEAKARYEESRPVYRGVGYKLGEANCIFGLGNIAQRRSDHAEARARFQEALLAYREVEDKLGEANCIYGLGNIALARSEHAEAKARYEEARPVYREVGTKRSEANCIKRLGDIALGRSEHAEAKARYEEALLIYREMGDKLGEANCIFNLGDIALARSEHGEAQARYEEALQVYREVGGKLGEANCVRSLGAVALARSEHAEAKARYEEALPVYREIEDKRGEANCIFGLGQIAMARSEHAEAQTRYEEALRVYQEVGDKRGEANCLGSLGDIALENLESIEARAKYQDAIALYRQFGDPCSLGYGLADLARVTVGQERRAALREARECFERIGRDDMLRELDEALTEDE